MQGQYWIFSEPLLKRFFMHCLNPIPVINVVNLAWLYVTRYVRSGSLFGTTWVLLNLSSLDMRTE